MYALRSKEDKMAVGFKVDYYWYQVGTSDFLHAFFSTICIRLERDIQHEISGENPGNDGKPREYKGFDDSTKEKVRRV